MAIKSSNVFALYTIYSLPHLIMTWLIGAIAILPGVYSKYYGLSLSTIANIILFARLFDALSDPVIGYYSDRHFSRSGTRKPYMVMGGLLFIFCSYFLYVPSGLEVLQTSSDASSPSMFVSPIYFACWFLLFYFSWTLFEIPHMAWAGELALTSADKTQIYSFRNVAGYLGVLLFYSIPLLPFFETNEITPRTLQFSTVTAGILMIPFLYFAIKKSPNGTVAVSSRQHVHHSSAKGPLIRTLNQRFFGAHSLLQSLIGNKPLILFLGAFLFYGVSVGMWSSLIFIYVDAYLDLGKQFAAMYLFGFAMGIAATPLWYKLAIVLGKKVAWLLAMVLLMASFIFTGTLSIAETQFSDLIMLMVIQTLGLTCVGAIAPAILSEIADYGRWKNGSDRSASYFSILTFITKTNAALGAALGLGIAGWFEFDATALKHTETSLIGLRLGIAWLPPVFAAIGLVFVMLTPINMRRHAIICRRLSVQNDNVSKKTPYRDHPRRPA